VPPARLGARWPQRWRAVAVGRVCYKPDAAAGWSLLLLPGLLLASQLAGCSCAHVECVIVVLPGRRCTLKTISTAALGAGIGLLPAPALTST